MDKLSPYALGSSDSEYSSDYSSSDDDFVVFEDDQDSSDDGENQSSSSDQNDEFYDENNDFGPWEEYTEATYLEDVVPTFRKKHKARGLFTHLSEPVEFFNLFLNDDLLEEICTLSDKYYHRHCYGVRRAQRSHKKKWTKPDLVEIRAFLAYY